MARRGVGRTEAEQLLQTAGGRLRAVSTGQAEAYAWLARNTRAQRRTRAVRRRRRSRLDAPNVELIEPRVQRSQQRRADARRRGATGATKRSRSSARGPASVEIPKPMADARRGRAIVVREPDETVSPAGTRTADSASPASPCRRETAPSARRRRTVPGSPSSGIRSREGPHAQCSPRWHRSAPHRPAAVSHSRDSPPGDETPAAGAFHPALASSLLGLTFVVVPLDDRPVTAQLPRLLGAIAGVRVVEPPSPASGATSPGRSGRCAALAARRRRRPMRARTSSRPTWSCTAASLLRAFPASRGRSLHALGDLAAFAPPARAVRSPCSARVMRLAPTGVPALGPAAAFPFAGDLWPALQEYAGLPDPPQTAPDRARAERLRARSLGGALDAYLACARATGTSSVRAAHRCRRRVRSHRLGQDDAGRSGCTCAISPHCARLPRAGCRRRPHRSNPAPTSLRWRWSRRTCARGARGAARAAAYSCCVPLARCGAVGPPVDQPICSWPAGLRRRSPPRETRSGSAPAGRPMMGLRLGRRASATRFEHLDKRVKRAVPGS